VNDSFRVVVGAHILEQPGLLGDVLRLYLWHSGKALGRRVDAHAINLEEVFIVFIIQQSNVKEGHRAGEARVGRGFDEAAERRNAQRRGPFGEVIGGEGG
jgi:hypothetical protein